MADTLGGLIDKLVTVDLKMWNNQEFLYEVRKMSFEDFEEKFTSTRDARFSLFESVKKCCDLNMQRNQLIDEVDKKIVEIINAGLEGKNLDDGKFIQRKHKTY